MNQLRSFGALAIALVALVAGLALPMSAAAGADAPPEVPAKIAVPAGSVLIVSRQARGVQIYDCASGQWALHAPRAQLFDPQAHGRNGVHFGGVDRNLTPGPWWESTVDGSRIRGAKVDEAPSPNAGSIPLLLLKVVERQGAGEFTPATYVQRLNTVGGLSPAGACKPGMVRDIPYTADYYFYTTP